MHNKQHVRKHMLMMVAWCFIPLIVLYIMSQYFSFSANYVLWGALILCMGMHIVMMKEHKKAHT